MNTRHYSSVVAVVVLLTVWLLGAQRAAAQSLFPNTQQITYNPYYGVGPYENTIGGRGAYARVGFRPLPAAYSQPLPSPSPGYNYARDYNNYNYSGGNYVSPIGGNYVSPNNGNYVTAWPNSNYSPYGYYPNGYGR
jgi:hypothetical protein